MSIVIRPHPTVAAVERKRWHAYDEDAYDGAQDAGAAGKLGFGVTPIDAVADLRRKIKAGTSSALTHSACPST